MAKNLSCLDPGTVTLEDGSLFLQFDNKKDGNRLLVFASPSGLQYLADSQEISQDGTFNTTPSVQEEMFGQFYIFHGEIKGFSESTGTKSYTFPLVFVLMEHRSLDDYDEILQWLTDYWKRNKTAIRVCQNGDALSDMEPAIIAAEKRHLPAVDRLVNLLL